MTDNDLAYLPATRALELFASRELSPVELMKAVIARAEATNPVVNAFTFIYFEQALEQARQAEARYAAGAPSGVLDGLPVAIKDESHIEGWPMTNGSLILKDFVSTHTSPVNARILAEGAIVHARTATPEFSCSGVTWSRLWGVTRSPWNPEFTSGGSSGGSGAALAAGSATLCTGSDIGGSIRLPASACGIVGFKPPYGRNPDDPPFNLDFFNHAGPMARTVEDTILLQNVMSGPHPNDIATVSPKLVIPRDPGSARGMRIALSMNLGSFEVDPQVVANTLAATERMRAAGMIVEEVDLPWGTDVLDACIAYLTHLFGGYISTVLDEHGSRMTSYARHFGERALGSTPQHFVAALDVIARMYAPLGKIFESYDALVCPTMSAAQVPADYDQSVGGIVINGKEVNPFLGWGMTTPFNAMSRCPVLAVPSGFSATGAPTGIQIVGRPFQDVDVFRIALAYEAETGGWYGNEASRPAL